jgi:hypothetical protein
MKLEEIDKWLIVGILILLVGVAYKSGIFFRNYPVMFHTLVDLCFSYYQENEGKYPYIQGRLSIPTQTFNVNGKIVAPFVVFKKFNPQMWCDSSGYGNELWVFFKLCNSKGDCVERDQIIYTWTYKNDYNDCLNNCNKYNYVGQCKSEARQKLPIAYTCTNICLFQGDFSINYFNQIPGDYVYTLTITKVKKYYCTGSCSSIKCEWVDTSTGDLPEMYYVIFYNPAESPITTTTTTPPTTTPPSAPSGEVVKPQPTETYIAIGIFAVIAILVAIIFIFRKRW